MILGPRVAESNTYSSVGSLRDSCCILTHSSVLHHCSDKARTTLGDWNKVYLSWSLRSDPLSLSCVSEAERELTIQSAESIPNHGMHHFRIWFSYRSTKLTRLFSIWYFLTPSDFLGSPITLPGNGTIFSRFAPRTGECSALSAYKNAIYPIQVSAIKP